MPTVISDCINSPVFGCKFKPPSTYCADHHSLDDDEPATKKAKLIVTINLKDWVCKTKNLPSVAEFPENDDPKLHVACESASAVQKFYARTAAVMFIARPGDIIVEFR